MCPYVKLVNVNSFDAILERNEFNLSNKFIIAFLFDVLVRFPITFASKSISKSLAKNGLSLKRTLLFD